MAWDESPMEGHEEISALRHINIHFINNDLLLIPEIKPSNSLWRYNFDENKWNPWHNFAKICNCISYHTSALNNNQTKLYLFGDPGYTAIMNLETGEIVESTESHYDGAHSKSLFINNQFHVFGGWDESGKYHSVYNEEENKLERVHYFNEINSPTLTQHKLCYMPSLNSVLIVSNIDSKVYLYSLDTYKCESLDYVNILKSSWVSAAFLLGNKKILMYSTTLVAVLDLNLKTVTKSTAKTPGNVNYVLMKNDKAKRELVTFGYVHQQKELGDVPMEIIRMIESFWYYDFLCFIGYGEYFTMNVDKIIKQSE